MAPVRIPGRAAGSTTRPMVWLLVAPRARLASRQARGTCFKASSVVLMITGSVRTARVRMPESRLTLKPRAVTKNARPKRPNTIEGTPARLATDRRTMSTTGPCLPYSLSHTAQATPKGSAIRMAPAARRKVPRRQGKTPPSVIISRGESKTKPGPRTPTPLIKRNTQAITRAAQLTAAAERRARNETTWAIARLARVFSRACPHTLVLVVMVSASPYTAGVLYFCARRKATALKINVMMKSAMPVAKSAW